MDGDHVVQLCLAAKPRLQPRTPPELKLNPDSAWFRERIGRSIAPPSEAILMPIETALGRLPAFTQFAGPRYAATSPLTGQGVSLRSIAVWLLTESFYGNPSEAMKRLEELVSEDAVTGLEVSALWGLNPASEIDLGPQVGVQLVSLASVPQSRPADELLGVALTVGVQSEILRIVPRPRAALVCMYRQSPLFHDPETDPAGSSKGSLLRDIAHVLTLFSEVGVGHVAHWCQVTGSPPIFLTSNGWSGSALEHAYQRLIDPSVYEEAEIRSMVAAYLALAPSRPYLREALIRVNRAKIEMLPREKALELGIAIECVLVERNTPNRTATIKRRGAAALGGGAADLDRLDTLYDLRSWVAHAGVLPEMAPWDGHDVDSRTILDEGIRMCERLIRRELSTGVTLKQG